MKKILLSLLVLAALVGGGVFIWIKNRPEPALETRFSAAVRNESKAETEDLDEDVLGEKDESNNETASQVNVISPPARVELNNSHHVYQTFNNCGPATLSMILNYWGVDKSQEELGDIMRPYQIPSGDNDDKTIFSYEFVRWARENNLMALSRPNGDIPLLHELTANGIPVVVKTWLAPNEDIGHFRLVLGYDEDKQVVIQDDSYEGRGLEISYWDFMNMWQAFNYNYILVYPEEKEELVAEILGSEISETNAWENALARAEREAKLDSSNPYPLFNQATAYYHLGQYQEAVSAYEQVASALPKRMMWYQIEPILAYYELGNYDRVFEITNNILENGNRAYSELYLLQGMIYENQGNNQAVAEARSKAGQYNILENAEATLNSLMN